MTLSPLPRTARTLHSSDGVQHYTLLLRVGRGEQMSFEAFDVWARIRTAIESVHGSLAGVEARGPYAYWTFSCAQSFEDVATLIGNATTDAAWALKCDDRMQYDGWSQREFTRLIATFEQG